MCNDCANMESNDPVCDNCWTSVCSGADAGFNPAAMDVNLVPQGVMEDLVSPRMPLPSQQWRNVPLHDATNEAYCGTDTIEGAIEAVDLYVDGSGVDDAPYAVGVTAKRQDGLGFAIGTFRLQSLC